MGFLILWLGVQVLSGVPILYWGIAKSVRHGTLTPVFAGSSPTTPANKINAVAEWVDAKGKTIKKGEQSKRQYC